MERPLEALVAPLARWQGLIDWLALLTLVALCFV